MLCSFQVCTALRKLGSTACISMVADSVLASSCDLPLRNMLMGFATALGMFAAAACLQAVTDAGPMPRSGSITRIMKRVMATISTHSCPSWCSPMLRAPSSAYLSQMWVRKRCSSGGWVCSPRMRSHRQVLRPLAIQSPTWACQAKLFAQHSTVRPLPGTKYLT